MSTHTQSLQSNLADGENRNLRRKTEPEKAMTSMETQTEEQTSISRPTESKKLSKLIEQYGCGPVQFTGTYDALYERHLVFDNVMEAADDRRPRAF